MTGLIGGPFPAQQGGGAFEIGFQLRFEHWGEGYASEAARAVISYAFRTLGISRESYALTGLFHPSYRLTRGAFETAPPS